MATSDPHTLEPVKDAPTWWQWRRRVWKRRAMAAACLGAGQVVCLAFRDHFFLFDLAAHFTLWVTAAMCVGLGVSLWLRQMPLALAHVMVGTVLFLYSGEYLDRAKTLEPHHDPMVSLISFNVHTANLDKLGVVDFVKRRDADLVLLLEVDEAWAHTLKELNEHYRYQAIHPRSDNFGLALFSKHPMAWTIMKASEGGVPYVDAQVQHRSGKFRFIGVHALPPLNARQWGTSRQQMQTILQTVDDAGPVIMAGDFNTTPNGALYQQIIRSGRFRSVGQNSPFRPTWGPWLAILQIDHVFVSPQLWSTRKKVGPSYGSDHRPVSCEVVLSPVLFVDASGALEIR